MATTRKQTDAPEKAAGKAADEGIAALQAQVDEDEAKGYHGVSPDPTPRANYTVAGVIAGAPTPETDEQAKADALDPKKVR